MRSRCTLTKVHEQTIFHHIGNRFQTEDREIHIVARLEEPLVVVLGNVLSDEECDELIRLSKDNMHRSKIGYSREVNDIRTSSGMFLKALNTAFCLLLKKEYPIL